MITTIWHRYVLRVFDAKGEVVACVNVDMNERLENIREEERSGYVDDLLRKVELGHLVDNEVELEFVESVYSYRFPAKQTQP